MISSCNLAAGRPTEHPWVDRLTHVSMRQTLCSKTVCTMHSNCSSKPTTWSLRSTCWQHTPRLVASSASSQHTSRNRLDYCELRGHLQRKGTSLQRCLGKAWDIPCTASAAVPTHGPNLLHILAHSAAGGCTTLILQGPCRQGSGTGQIGHASVSSD